MGELSADQAKDRYLPTLLDGVSGSTHCSACGRTLTDRESILSGMGPVCRAKAGGRRVKIDKENPTDQWDATTMDVTFRRHGTLGITNVPWVHQHHSPTGMEWGYYGSGAADMALNTLAMFLPISLSPKKGRQKHWTVEVYGKTSVSGRAYELHQDFKVDFIAPMNYLGGRIKGEDVRRWLMSKGCSETEISAPIQKIPEVDSVDSGAIPARKKRGSSSKASRSATITTEPLPSSTTSPDSPSTA